MCYLACCKFWNYTNLFNTHDYNQNVRVFVITHCECASEIFAVTTSTSY